ncbi:hypothetical protein NC651_029550 [Populus alba x Populus x berolinensis]|nr:hypothetical protein NC651_029550 [Populus alba x Populus x berolinensis]
MAHTPTYCRHQTTQLEGELTNQAAETSTLALNIQSLYHLLKFVFSAVFIRSGTVLIHMPRSSSSSLQPRPLHLESHLPYSQHSVLYESFIAEGGHKAKMLALVQETLKIGVGSIQTGQH